MATKEQYKKLGEALRLVREYRNLKQSYIARIIGYEDASSYAKIERGEISIDVFRLFQICAALDVSMVNIMLLSGFDMFMKDGSGNVQTLSDFKFAISKSKPMKADAVEITVNE